MAVEPDVFILKTKQVLSPGFDKIINKKVHKRILPSTFSVNVVILPKCIKNNNSFKIKIYAHLKR